MSEPKRLWESDHPYYWTGDHEEEVASWQAFAEGWGESDEDYNLVARWDWLNGEEDGLDEGQEAVRIGFVHQRKGSTSSVIVIVTQEDEPAIRLWLEGKWKHMQRLWAPFAPA